MIECCFRADVCIFVDPLQSGYSVDIGGKILVASSNAQRHSQSFIFKALDTGVKCTLLVR